MDTGILANGIAAVGYLVMDVLGFTLLLGMLIYGTYRGDPYPLDNSHPHPTH
jgi:hypothetical protein